MRSVQLLTAIQSTVTCRNSGTAEEESIKLPAEKANDFSTFDGYSSFLSPPQPTDETSLSHAPLNLETQPLSIRKTVMDVPGKCHVQSTRRCRDTASQKPPRLINF